MVALLQKARSANTHTLNHNTQCKIIMIIANYEQNTLIISIAMLIKNTHNTLKPIKRDTKLM